MRVSTFGLSAVGLSAFAWAVGCSVIVSGDVPEFSCTGTATTSCPTGYVCDQRAGRCVVSFDASEVVDDAGEEEPDAAIDDATTEIDATVDAPPSPPFDLGFQCHTNVECKSGLCGTNTLLTQPIVESTGPVCTKTCCTSDECDPGFVCFGSGSGGNYCVDAKKAQRAASNPGARGPGVACKTDSECRSGLCSKGRCIDTCCLQKDCASGTICQVGSMPGVGPAHDTWVCAPQSPQATKELGDKCNNEPNECTNNNCIGGGVGYCRPSCCRAADCSTISPQARCSYTLGPGDTLKYCTPGPKGNGANESACTSDGDCDSLFCDQESKKCAEVCCQDSDCPTSRVCRPSSQGLLRCVTGKR